MLKRVYYLLSTLLIVMLLAPAALAAPVHQEVQTIVDIATEDERFSTLVDLLTQAELVETLRGETPFTVFAPTNEAFENLPEAVLTELQDNPERLTNTLLYHVVEGRVMSGDITDTQTVSTMQETPLEFTIDEGQVSINNGVEVVEADIEASNGVIHVINDVLLPPLEIESDTTEMDETDMTDTAVATDTTEMTDTSAVTDTAEADGVDTAETSDTLVAACIEDYVVQADDWLSRLALRYYEDPLFYTAIYEATNVAAGSEATYSSIADPNLIEIGQTVCIPSQRDAQAIMAGVTTLDEGTPADEPSPTDAVVTDDEASMPADESMTEPMTDQTIVQVLAADERFSTLVEAVQAANLTDTLESEGPFTLFAPTNEAFDALPEGMLDELLANEVAVQDVLLYHVIDGRATSADVIRMDAAPTLEGTSAAVVYDADQEMLMVGNGTVIEEDIQAANGVIHVVDSVLLPPTDPNPVDEVE